MDFIGLDSQAALRLKDATLDHPEASKAHRDLCLVLWKLYSECKLVHADFSEYNILYMQVGRYDHPRVPWSNRLVFGTGNVLRY